MFVQQTDCKTMSDNSWSPSRLILIEGSVRSTPPLAMTCPVEQTSAWQRAERWWSRNIFRVTSVSRAKENAVVCSGVKPIGKGAVLVSFTSTRVRRECDQVLLDSAFVFSNVTHISVL